LFKIALVNLGFTLSGLLTLLAGSFLSSLPVPAAPLLAAGAVAAGGFWCLVYLAAAARAVTGISDYGSFGPADFLRALGRAWPAGLMMGAFALLLWALARYVIPFYGALNSTVGMALAAVSFWFLAGGVLALQFFLTIHARLENRLVKAVKKAFLIFLDNPLFCLFSLIHDLLVLALSAFLLFLVPGPAGVLLYLDEALRLRLLKYDWLEANPSPAGSSRRRIPWEEILAEEREKTGNRSFKSFIFPWKE
ncbi:MAG: hypothetical protein LBG84_00905, partial [Treponema sp.]|nr:hypothetical protein [Treponema sp.]